MVYHVTSTKIVISRLYGGEYEEMALFGGSSFSYHSISKL